MKEVHIIRWIPTGKIGDVYSDHKKATKVAEASNKKRTWRHKLLRALDGSAHRWIVQTFDVKD